MLLNNETFRKDLKIASLGWQFNLCRGFKIIRENTEKIEKV